MHLLLTIAVSDYFLATRVIFYAYFELVIWSIPFGIGGNKFVIPGKQAGTSGD